MVSEIENRPPSAADTPELARWVVPFFIAAAVAFVGLGLIFVVTTIF